MVRKIVCLALCGIMLALSLASCGEVAENSAGAGGVPGGDPVTSTILSEEEQNAINTRITALKSEVPDGFGGEDFNVLGAKDASFFPTEENLTGDMESDAVYKRNLAVEETFDVKIVNTKEENPNYVMERLDRDINGGIYTFNLVNSGVVSTGQYIFKKKQIAPVDTFTHIDLNSPWWQASLEEYYAIGDRLFFLSGDISPSYFSAPICILYSKKLMNDYSIEDDLYSLVNAGAWTIDKMFEKASNIPGGGDIYRYGNHSDEAPGVALYFGAGFTITKFDGDHYPYLDTKLPEGAYNLMTKVSEQTGNTSLCYGIDYRASGEFREHHGEEAQELFADDKILFFFDDGGGISELRELDVSGFGILPIPKASADQKDYISYARSEGPAVYFPINNEDIKMTGIITEAMGAYGYRYIRPAFYDQRLKSKGVYDVESKAMLDLIYSNQVYDLYDMYGQGTYEVGNGEIIKMLHTAVFTDPEGIVGKYESAARLANKMVQNQLIKTANSYG